jgi:DNA-binding CsgD family transcriptional regulator
VKRHRKECAGAMFAAQEERSGVPDVGAPRDLTAWRLKNGLREFALFELPAEAAIAVRIDERLTPAEAEVARSMAAGLTNDEIALGRRTSSRTVANQVASIFRKLGVGSRRELVALASRLSADRSRRSP